MPSILTAALTVPLGAAATALCLPLVAEAAALSSRRRRRGVLPGAGAAPNLLVLVPAHDEELLIESCVRSLLEMDYPASARRVVVIADNCTDRTAELARAAGAECLERTDTENRGKPRAIAWTLEQLRPYAWADAIVIVDADTVVDRGFARGLAAHAPLRDRAVQAYFGTLNEWESWLTRLAGVLARGRYEVTYPLKQRAGLNCPLTGNGMCIGSGLLEAEGWQAFSLTENWELYARYTAEGVAIDYAGGALLLSQEVRSMSQGDTQRRRWLAGRTGVLREWAGPILRSRRIGALQKLDALLELGALSPVLHLVAASAVGGASMLLLEPPARWWVAGLAALSLVPQVATTAIVIARHPQRAATLAAFLRLPAYAAWRVVLAGRTLVGRHSEWRKTERHEAAG